MQDKLMEINNTDKTESVSTFLLLAFFLFPRESNFSYEEWYFYFRQVRFSLAS